MLFLFFAVVYFGSWHIFSSLQPGQESAELLPVSEHVKDVTTKTSNLLVPGDKPKVILVHAPWCGHCKRMMPDFLKAAEQLPNVEWLRVGDIAAKELAQRTDMKGFPTIYGVSVKGVKTHEGLRSASHLIQFAKSL